jgi:hypothetical protein
MELNREQIIKALECCTSGHCYIGEGCPLADMDDYDDDITKCTSELSEHALALIKELINDKAELKHQIQEEIVEDDINLFDEYTRMLHEGIRKAKANTVQQIQLKMAMHYGTYTDKDMTPITEVFSLLDQIAKEMLEG